MILQSADAPTAKATSSKIRALMIESGKIGIGRYSETGFAIVQHKPPKSFGRRPRTGFVFLLTGAVFSPNRFGRNCRLVSEGESNYQSLSVILFKNTFKKISCRTKSNECVFDSMLNPCKVK